MIYDKVLRKKSNINQDLVILFEPSIKKNLIVFLFRDVFLSILVFQFLLRYCLDFGSIYCGLKLMRTLIDCWSFRQCLWIWDSCWYFSSEALYRGPTISLLVFYHGIWKTTLFLFCPWWSELLWSHLLFMKWYWE